MIKNYRLAHHPTTSGIPIGIWEFNDDDAVRLVAKLKDEAHATMEEAHVMLKALQGMIDDAA